LDYGTYLLLFFIWRNSPQWAMTSSFKVSRSHSATHQSLDALSTRCRDLYLTTHNTHNKQTSMPPVRFEPTISAGERTQTYP